MNEPCRVPLCDYCDRWWRDCRCRLVLWDEASAARARRRVDDRHRAAIALAVASDSHRARRVAAARLDALQMKETTR